MMIQRVAISVLALGLVMGSVPASAQLFGPSDEEKAREAAQDSGLHDLQGASQQQDARIRDLEDKVRGLTQSLSQATGANEELSHQIQLQNDKLGRMEKDFAYRLCTLSAQQMGANDSMNCAAAGTPSASAAPPPPQAMRAGDALPPLGAAPGNAPGNSGFNAPDNGPAVNGPAVLGRPPGNLGSLPMGSGGPPPPSGAPPSGAGDSAQYDQAMNLMSRAQYSEAAAAFRAYADANPGDTELTPQAIYWVANISFVRQDYAPAARTFAEVIKKYPKSLRAPDAMLKLAQSFMAMGQKSEGCTTLGLIKSKYPAASPQTLTSAANLRKTACSK
jgi:tol-pal system protein YbgF